MVSYSLLTRVRNELQEMIGTLGWQGLIVAVSARARQLNHRLKNRKNAIISRREVEATADDEFRSYKNGNSVSHRSQNNGGDSSSNSPTSGFTAVNSRSPLPNERSSQHNGSSHSHPQTSNKSTTNGTAFHGASAATKAELLNNFRTKSDRPSPSHDPAQARRLSNPMSRNSTSSKPSSKSFTDSTEYSNILMTTASPVPIPNTPSSLLPYVKPTPADRFDDSGPYKADMMARMEQLQRGDRVQPPCDRCRRLHMDCLKNLTACMGCTKKHAKCSWKDVEEQELRDHPFIPKTNMTEEGNDTGSDDGRESGNGTEVSRRKELVAEKVGVRDEELLGEESGDEEVEMSKEPEKSHSIRSTSPPTIMVTRGAEDERMELLPRSFARSPPYKNTQASDDAKSSQISNGDSQPSPMAILGEMAEIADATYEAFDRAADMHQRPPAEMRNKTNGTNGHTATQYEKDIYTQLSEATQEVAEPVRVYTAGSEPLQLESSRTQQSMEAADTDSPVEACTEKPHQMPSRPQQGQKLPSPSIDDQDMTAERLPTLPLQSEDVHATQMEVQGSAGQTQTTQA